MKRTTVFIPDELHEQLRQEAFRRRVSMAHLIRRRLEGRRPEKTRRATADPLRAVEGIIRDGSLAEGIDEALYGS
ncbi:MAG: hypothetical protein HYR60_28175 [Acidobacteria bacterium]|nr:hypothetical protein [Acidobacteriota bacterium]